MSFPRPIASHTRNLSLAGGQPSAGQQAALVARVAEKKAELANLRELQKLSASVADQMQMLEDKLSTLADGTEAVATVLANWHSVLRAINLASSQLSKSVQPKSSDQEDPVALPQQLVRIPTEHAGLIQEQVRAGTTDD